MLRHAWQMRTDPLRFLVGPAARLGDMVAFPIPGRPVLYVCSPAGVGRVLQTNHRAYGKDTVQYRALSLVTGDGLLVSDGEAWLAARRTLQPAFHRSTLNRLGDVVGSASMRLMAQWSARPPGSVVDVDAAMMRTTLTVVGEALLGADLAGVDQRLSETVVQALDCVVARARSPVSLPLSVPSPGNARLRRSVASMDAMLADVVSLRRAAEPPRRDGTGDVLGLLLASGLSPRQVRDQLVTLVVAGHETVASALTWALWLLSGDMAVQGRLAEESDRVLAGRQPSHADVARLPYARQVLDEALRLYPPAWALTRRALQPDVLAGVDVPAGSLVIISPYALHRHPALWEGPDRFDPDRFDPARFDPARSGPGLGAPGPLYLPFGAGPRMCIGRELALVEGVLLLAALSGRFRLLRTPGQVVRPRALVTIRPAGGLPLRLVPRSRDGAPR
jgi:cytochrome P450